MTSKTIHRGTSRAIGGDLAAGDTLLIQGGASGGGAGGVGVVSGHATSEGALIVAGGLAGSSGGLGAELDVRGELDSAGSIAVEAGGVTPGALATGGGGMLLVTGTLALSATSTLEVQGGRGSNSGTGSLGGTLVNAGEMSSAGVLVLTGSGGGETLQERGAGARLNNSGTLANTGTLIIEGGPAGPGIYANGGLGATLTDTGVLTNSGSLSILGGSGGGYYAAGATGGTLAVDGVLINTGHLLLGGGGAFRQYGYGGGGAGGVLRDTGTVNNAGSIEVAAGAGDDGSHESGTGGQADIDGILSNTGTITLDGAAGHYKSYAGSGTLSLSGVLSNAGSIAIAGGQGLTYSGTEKPTFGALLAVGAGGALTNSGALSVGGGQVAAGNTRGGNGGTLSVSGAGASLINDGVLTLHAGAPGDTFPEAESYGGLGGVLTIGADSMVDNEGSLLVQGGPAGLYGELGGYGATATLAGLLIQHGTLTVDRGLGSSPAVVTLLAGGLIDNMSGLVQNSGSIALQADSAIEFGTVHNTGLIGGVGEIAYTNLVNDSTVAVGAGRLWLNGVTVTADPGAHGQFEVGANGLLDLGSSLLDASQIVSLTSSSATVSVQSAFAANVQVSSTAGTLLVVGGGNATLNAADSHLTVALASATNLTLNTMGFITALGSASFDDIVAGSSNQTLTGGGGFDTLKGSSTTGDTFQDTAAGLNGDFLLNFRGTDEIDVTNIAAGSGLLLNFTQNYASQGSLDISNGGVSTTITIEGQFTTSDFVTSSDGHGGVLVTLHG